MIICIVRMIEAFQSLHFAAIRPSTDANENETKEFNLFYMTPKKFNLRHNISKRDISDQHSMWRMYVRICLFHLALSPLLIWVRCLKFLMQTIVDKSLFVEHTLTNFGQWETCTGKKEKNQDFLMKIHSNAKQQHQYIDSVVLTFLDTVKWRRNEKEEGTKKMRPAIYIENNVQLKTSTGRHRT